MNYSLSGLPYICCLSSLKKKSWVMHWKQIQWLSENDWCMNIATYYVSKKIKNGSLSIDVND